MLTRALSGSGGGSSAVDIQRTQIIPSDGIFICGFEPKYIIISFFYSSSGMFTCVWDSSTPNSQLQMYEAGATAYQTIGLVDNQYCISEIKTNGFKMSSIVIRDCNTFSYLAVG